jgi:hypothetical protein
MRIFMTDLPECHAGNAQFAQKRAPAGAAVPQAVQKRRPRAARGGPPADEASAAAVTLFSVLTRLEKLLPVPMREVG